ncbi:MULTISPECIES: hypothetical protein [Mycolicibacterium]|uniref:hypothetical protein n=1 Tax=Mycolicibacterium TaxID=1866885 RepID=UPI00084866C3|nr:MULTISPECIES: hypothetical protein [Mycolicibacterium]ODR16922.1 hypothetical protein BHQ19_30095 [Mycolicibacterium porcinum]
MLTRPSIPAVLTLLGRAVAQPDVHEGNDLILTAQLLAMTARRAELEPGYIESEVRAYRAVGEAVVAEGHGDTVAIRAALDELDSHLSSGSVAAQDFRAYSLASEVLCLAIDATRGATGPATEATAAALALREEHQAQIVGDFTVAGR